MGASCVRVHCSSLLLDGPTTVANGAAFHGYHQIFHISQSKREYCLVIAQHPHVERSPSCGKSFLKAISSSEIILSASAAAKSVCKFENFPWVKIRGLAIAGECIGPPPRWDAKSLISRSLHSTTCSSVQACLGTMVPGTTVVCTTVVFAESDRRISITVPFGDCRIVMLFGFPSVWFLKKKFMLQ